MNTNSRLVAIAATVAMAAAVAGAPLTTLGVGTVSGSLDNSTIQATTISQCQVIDEPGHYDLTRDLENDSTCIEITASNVTLDGNGYSIAANSSDARKGVYVHPANDSETLQDVHVTNLVVSGWNNGIYAEATQQPRLTNIAATNTSLTLYQTSNGTVTESTVEDGTINIGSGQSSQLTDTTLIDTTARVGSHTLVSGLDGDGARVATTTGATDVMIRNNQLQKVHAFQSSSVTIANNTPDDSGRFAIELSLMSEGTATITGNHITGNTGQTGAEAGITADYIHNLTVTNNQITGNDVGIDIRNIRARDTEDGKVAGSVEVHRNDLSDNTQYGILNRDTTIVDATANYWGPNGPSSEGSDDPLEDPETGALADGDGSAVSPHPDRQGVSNVHFDDWLTQEPTADNGNGNGNQTTTTTTTTTTTDTPTTTTTTSDGDDGDDSDC